MINWNEIETKWRNKWAESKDFETNPNEKPKKFITVAYPYPNSPQHIGHGRTYTLADVHARDSIILELPYLVWPKEFRKEKKKFLMDYEMYIMFLKKISKHLSNQ
jgi:hypothetical protein